MMVDRIVGAGLQGTAPMLLEMQNNRQTIKTNILINSCWLIVAGSHAI